MENTSPLFTFSFKNQKIRVIFGRVRLKIWLKIKKFYENYWKTIEKKYKMVYNYTIRLLFVRWI